MTSINDLTIRDVLSIRKRVEAGEFQHVIASEYGMNQGRINEIVKGKRFISLAVPKKTTAAAPTLVKVLMFTQRP